jgi:SAM-dependent methyltransferase
MRHYFKKILTTGMAKLTHHLGLREIAETQREMASDIRELREIGRHISFREAPSGDPQNDEAAVASDGLPIPPEDLHFLITGNHTFGIADFLNIGGGCAGNVVDLLKKHGVDIDCLDAILDFGCGCGRTIRHFRALQRTKVFGTDYDQRLIKWCRKNLPFATFTVNQLCPPLDYRERMFDCIYAFSVFTHFSRELQLEWMQELSRVLKPDGYVLLSMQGEAYATNLPAPERERFAAGELVVQNEDAVGKGECMAYHPYRYVEQTLASGFDLLDFFPGEVIDPSRGMISQDIYFLRRRA